ncbi:hypothetical protein DFP72DRAFT_816364 [Ephemerocybe angulata]|uniref:Uncharacterized protein n=1 Tax=Ephemerocybe angulata TaxID=980116 RepID=A0A8H6HTN8_9AGAR|nr:hypothetical protein DFP72DRAFT_816364 [Tulosesus angulatus]
MAYVVLKEEWDEEESLGGDGSPAFTADDKANHRGGRVDLFITSPNMRKVPRPPCGIRRVHARADGRYADADRMQYPQYLGAGFDWMCCIPVPGSDPNLSALWMDIQPEDAPVVDNTIIITVACRLKSEICDTLQAQMNRTITLAYATRAKHPTATLLSSLVVHICQCLESLESHPMPFKDILLSFRDFQRSCLDVHGIAKYLEDIYPRSMPETLKDDRMHSVDVKLMGAFTNSRAEAQFLHRLGIPVWWVRPSFSFNPDDTKVFKSADVGAFTEDYPIVEAEYTQFGSTSRVFEDIYVGLPGSRLQAATQRLGCRLFNFTESSRQAWNRIEKKYVASAGPSRPIQPIHMFALPGFADMAHAIPPAFSPSSGSSSSQITPATSTTLAPPDSSTSSQSASLIRANGVLDPMPGRNAPCPDIPSWVTALNALSSLPMPNCKETKQIGHKLPDPALILGPRVSDNNKAIYLCTWMLTRQEHYANLAKGLIMGAIDRQSWRNHMKASKGFLEPSPEIPAPPSAGTNIASTSTFHALPPKPPTQRQRPGKKRRKNRDGGDGDGDDDDSPSLTPSTYLSQLSIRNPDDDPIDKLLWFEETIMLGTEEDLRRALTPQITAEVVYDLRTTTWQLELLALDQELAHQKWFRAHDDNDLSAVEEATHRNLQREDAVRSCFASGHCVLGELFPKDIPNVDRGVAAYNWAIRHPTLLSLRTLMLDWEGCPASLVNTPRACGINATARLESEVTMFYCRSFYQTFGRAPITPCRLPFRARARQAPARTFGAALCRLSFPSRC